MGFFSRLFRRLFWLNDPELLGRDGELHVANLLSRLDGTRYFVHNDVLNNSPLKREGFLGTSTDFSFRSF